MERKAPGEGGGCGGDLDEEAEALEVVALCGVDQGRCPRVRLAVGVRGLLGDSIPVGGGILRGDWPALRLGRDPRQPAG